MILCDLPPTTLEAEFRRRCYPQIQDLIIPVDAYPLLQAFPQITKLTITRPHSISDSFHDHGGELYEAIYANCHQLTSLMTDAFVHLYKLSWDGARRPDHGQRLCTISMLENELMRHAEREHSTTKCQIALHIKLELQ